MSQEPNVNPFENPVEIEMAILFDEVLEMYEHGISKNSVLNYIGLDKDLNSINKDIFFDVGDNPRLTTYYTNRVPGSANYRYNKIVTVLGTPEESNLAISVIVPAGEVPIHMTHVAMGNLASEIYNERVLYGDNITENMYRIYIPDSSSHATCNVTGNEVFIALFYFMKNRVFTSTTATLTV